MCHQVDRAFCKLFAARCCFHDRYFELQDFEAEEVFEANRDLIVLAVAGTGAVDVRWS